MHIVFLVWFADSLKNWLQDTALRVVMFGSSLRWCSTSFIAKKYINDINEVVVGKRLKFLDNTKLSGVAANQQNLGRLQANWENVCS